MHCPYCSFEESKVIDSRLVTEGSEIRRRRECLKCGERWTTFEVGELVMPKIIKQDKSRVVYENDEVGVHHAFVTFDDGNVEAVMAVYRYKDGKIISLETGATPMPK